MWQVPQFYIFHSQFYIFYPARRFVRAAVLGACIMNGNSGEEYEHDGMN